jgi:hypothetical protein
MGVMGPIKGNIAADRTFAAPVFSLSQGDADQKKMLGIRAGEGRSHLFAMTAQMSALASYI